MSMNEHLGRRLAELREQKQNGEQQLLQLENRAQDLRSTLLRINGAITVLEEVMAENMDQQG